MMMINVANALMAMAQAPPPGVNPKGELVKMVGYMAILGVVFYVIVIRPQRLRTKQLEKTISSLKAGDKVVTSSGIVGIVVGVKDKTLSIRSADTKLEILKSAVTEITERSGEPAPS